MPSPTQRTIKHLKTSGWTVAIVEKWNPHIRIRQDLFGFADILAMKSGETPKLIQVTSTGWASRVKKILEIDAALIALKSGFEIEVHGWRKLKSNRNRHTIKVIPLTLKDFKC